MANGKITAGDRVIVTLAPLSKVYDGRVLNFYPSFIEPGETFYVVSLREVGRKAVSRTTVPSSAIKPYNFKDYSELKLSIERPPATNVLSA